MGLALGDGDGDVIDDVVIEDVVVDAEVAPALRLAVLDIMAAGDGSAVDIAATDDVAEVVLVPVLPDAPVVVDAAVADGAPGAPGTAGSLYDALPNAVVYADAAVISRFATDSCVVRSPRTSIELSWPDRYAIPPGSRLLLL